MRIALPRAFAGRRFPRSFHRHREHTTCRSGASARSHQSPSRTRSLSFVGAVAVDRDRGQAAVRAPPKSDGGDLQLERPEVQSEEMLQVELSGSRLVAEGGLLLATGIPAGLSVNVEFSGKQEGLVLGFSSEKEDSMVDVELGELVMERFLACARCKMWWMTPEWGTSGGELPLETQFLLTEVEKGGPYAAYIPLIDDRFRSTLRPTRAGSDGITLRIDSGDRSVRSRQWRAALLVAAGPEPFALVDAAVEAAAALSGGAKPRRSKQLPPSLDSFGWCTWDAFYSSVSARDLATGLQALVEGGVPPRMLIIDDGWQLTDVDADEREAPTQRLLRMPDVEETQEDFINAENEMLAELMEVNPRPAYHTLTTAMPTLSNTHRKPLAHHQAAARSIDDADGQQQQPPPASVPAPRTERREPRQAQHTEPLAQPAKPQAKPRSPVTLLVSLLQKIAGWGFGLLEAAFVAFYLSCIDPAPHNSLQVRWFGMLAQGPLRSAMLQFYASSGDFTRRLCSVRANSKFANPDSGPDDDYMGAAPSDLKWVVSDLKRRFGLEWVYMWHGLPAYWSGVMPGEAEMAKYEPRLVYPQPSQGLLEIEPNMAWNPTVLAGLGMVDNPSQLYSDMHSYLRNAGVDGVKVDCQAGVGLIGSVNGGGPALGRKFHTALEASIRQKFPGNHCINCMCHSTENLFRMEDTVVARASDDFYPRDSASVTPHIAACAYNSVFLAPLLQPDWDMFQSKHPAAELHAAARAISGAAIYVSDKPGQHDFELLRRLALPDGSILRPCGPCRPTTDSLFRDVLRDGASLLKVWNMNVHAGILAAFNLQGASWNRRVRQFRIHDASPSSISAEMRPADIPHLHMLDRSTPHFGGRYVLRSDATGEATVADSAQESVTVTLASQKSDIVSVTPVSSCRGVDFAPLGLPGMMNAAGAIRDWKLRFSSGGPGSQRLLHCLEVLGCGELLLFCSQPPSQVLASAAPGAAVVPLPCSSLPKPQLWRVQLPQQAGLRHHLQIAF